jgi:epoxyqueuosine reductase
MRTRLERSLAAVFRPAEDAVPYGRYAMSRGEITPAQRVLHWIESKLRSIGHPLFAGLWDIERLSWVTRVPVVPPALRRHHRPHVWSRPRGAVPDDLRTVAGIWRDPDAERAAYEDAPLHAFFQVHDEAAGYMLDHGWEYLLPTAPRYMRAIASLREARRTNRMLRREPAQQRPAADPEALTRQIRDEATRLGLSAVGFAPYDPKYAWAEFASRHNQGSVIVCLYEQDYEKSQTAPSATAERAAFYAYSELVERSAALARFAQRLGVKAQPHGPLGEGIVIHYAVQAGLGQLGLNGQLLTPQAGSRVRIAVITTDAELQHDSPQDFGVHKICDSCQVCARRCPVGAIPVRRQEHRGVTKIKIKTERCFPVVAKVEGCAICMKVCPVQRYGLDRVTAHFEQTGEILGKGSDELEGYRWPPDGRFYSAAAKPPVDSTTLLHPPGWQFDPQRKVPRALASAEASSDSVV